MSDSAPNNLIHLPINPATTRDGIIYAHPDDGRTVYVVDVRNNKKALDYGASCLNPDAPEEERVYRKVFRRKQIYLAGDFERALQEHLVGENVFVIGMNGFSDIKEDQARRYGVKLGAYEEACKAILVSTVRRLREEFPGVEVRLVDGASDMDGKGVDYAIAQAARELGVSTLGFTCPRYLIYVLDDERAVHVSDTPDAYGERFIQSLDMLICTGGRGQAFAHDIAAVFRYQRKLDIVDVLNSLSSTGGVPATVINDRGVPVVDNAAAAFMLHVSSFSRDQAVAATPPGGDRWHAIFDHTATVATGVCRLKMPVGMMFKGA